MGEIKRGRGRPPKPETLERRESERRAQQMLSKFPSFVKKEQLGPASSWLKGMEKAGQEILNDYRGYPTIPHEHIFEMASLGDESMSGHEARVLKKDTKHRQKAQEFRISGGDAAKTTAFARDAALCQKNRVLLERVKPLGPLKPTDAARIIQNQWEHIPPESRARGEERLTSRGVFGVGQDSGHIPSIKTITRAIGRASPFPQHRKRQSSRSKK